MLLPPVVQDAAWYGPATVTFHVQFAGDPYDPAVNDVRVRFLGDKSQREERSAFFDPIEGAWRATLFAREGGRYRAVLIRNGKESKLEAEEGIVDAERDDSVGILPATPARADRTFLDTGEPWFGVGPSVGPDATPEIVETLASAGATWVRLALPSALPGFDALQGYGPTLDALAKRNLAFTLVVPPTASEAWRRYVLARYGNDPRLVAWEGAALANDPLQRAARSASATWDDLFENLPGPFIVRADDPQRIRALRKVVETSDWNAWSTPRAWKGIGAKGVGETDRMILVAEPGAKPTGVPLADGSYDLTTVDPATGEATKGEVNVERASFTVPLPAQRFLVLRRRLP